MASSDGLLTARIGVVHNSGGMENGLLKDQGLGRAALRDSNGLAYRELRRTLAPRFTELWLQIALAWLSIVGVGVLLEFATRTTGLAAHVLGGILGGFAIGYALAYLHLFMHEAAHWNLAPGRKRNDLLANVVVGAVLGLDVGTYRPIHWEHHRHLGTPKDTENSYFEPLSLQFLLESLTGIRVLRVLAGRRRALRAGAAPASREGLRSRHQPWTAAVLNVGLLVTLGWFGWWSVALAWVLGIGSVFPLLASLRQVLEHRSQNADCGVDYSTQPHGSFNYMFGGGPISSTFGGAGFNRHLLHHWDPQVSCTRLRDLEVFLARTAFASELERSRTTYLTQFRRLFVWRCPGPRSD